MLFFPQKITPTTKITLAKMPHHSYSAYVIGTTVFSMTNSPFYLDQLQELLVTILHSAMVRDSVPISAVLVADSGTAKSKLLKQYMSEGGTGIHHTDSFSSQGLYHLMQADSENKIRYIVTPDFNPTLSRQQKTVTSTVANLLSLTMDGTCRIDDGRQEKLVKHKPIGLLTAVTPDIFATQTKRWYALGLTRRIIPLFYEYTNETIARLLSIVREGKITSTDFPEVHIKINGNFAPAIDQQTALTIESLAIQLGHHLGMEKGRDAKGKVRWWVRNIVPISPTVILRTLAQAHAIRRGVGKVESEDVHFITQFIDYTNPQKPRQI